MRAALVASVVAHAAVAAALVAHTASRGANDEDDDDAAKGVLPVDLAQAPAQDAPPFDEKALPASRPVEAPSAPPPFPVRPTAPLAPSASAPASAHGIGYMPIGRDAPEVLDRIHEQVASWSPYLVPPVHASAPSTWAPGPVLAGKVSPAAIARAVAWQAHPLLLCHGAGGAAGLAREGDVRIGFTLDPRGRVSEAHDAGGSFEGEAVRRCVVDAFRRFTFPWPANGKAQAASCDVYLPAEQMRPR